MKRYLLIFLCLITKICLPDLIYFWLENEDLTYQNLVSSESDNLFSANIINDEKSYKVNINVAQGNGYWRYNSNTKRYEYVKENLTVGDFGHKELDYADGRNSVVYVIDTGSIAMTQYDSINYMFILELDLQNGTTYTAQFLESELWRERVWPYKDHLCNPITMNYQTIPEPNSLLLIIVGSGLLFLKRRINNVSYMEP